MRDNKIHFFRHKFSIPAFALMIVVFLSFIPHFFFYVFNATSYLVALALFVILYIITKPVIIDKKYINILLLLIAVNMVISYLRSQRIMGSLVDIVVLLLGILSVIFYSRTIKFYSAAIKVIPAMSTFFAIGIITNRIFPSVYNLIVSAFPNSYSAILRFDRNVGFSTNIGFSTVYTITGLLTIIAFNKTNIHKSKIKLIQLIICIIGLLITEKRGPVLFLVFTLILCYLTSSREVEHIKRYWIIFIVALSLYILFIIFQDFLIRVPIIEKLTSTASAILTGENADISSGRINLYIWAIDIFKRNPLFGIGWGNYRTTVVGHATLKKLLDTHNVYLQLLCENGIIGFVLFVAFFAAFWTMARKELIYCSNSTNLKVRYFIPYSYFSFGYQTFFLLYSLSGNPLYDQHSQIIYMISCGILLTVQYARRCVEKDKEIML